MLNAALLAALLVLGGCFFAPVLQRRIPVHGDLGNFNLPVREFYARCLRQGDAFDWMPGLFCGYFITGEGQGGPYHPLHWLLYRWLPLDTAFALEVFLPVAVMALGMIVFLRRYTSWAGACLGALTATFAVKFDSFLQHPQMATVLAHIPWTLAAIDAAILGVSASRRRWAAVALALLTGSAVLLGHPQALFFALASGGLFALWQLIRQRCGLATWVAVGGAFVLGLAVGGVQLLSTYELFAATGRIRDDPVVCASQGLGAWDFWGLVAPQLFPWPQYFGAVPLMLTLWWLTAMGRGRRSAGGDPRGGAADIDSAPATRRLSAWAFGLAVASGLLGMGLAGKVYYLVLYLPVVGKFHAPHRYFAVTLVALAIIAALAFGRLMKLARARQRTPWVHLLLPWAAALSGTGVSLWYCWHTGPHPLETFLQNGFYMGPLMIVGAAAGLTLAARGRFLGLAILAAVAIADAQTFSVHNGDCGKVQWRHLPSYAEFLASYPPPSGSHAGRIFDANPPRLSWMAINRLCLHGERILAGYVALPATRLLDYSQVNALRVAEVAWRRDQPQVAAGVWPWPLTDWQAVPDPLPRVRLVSKTLVTADPRHDLKTIDVATTALVSHPLQLSAAPPGTAHIARDRPGSIAVDTDAPQRQLLVLSEAHDPAWQVRVDGQAAELERVNGDFMGCVVAPGRHRVDFTFAPAMLRWGRIISLAAVCLALALGMVPLGFAGGVRQARSP